MRHNNNYIENFSYWLFKDRIPATKLLIIVSVLAYLVQVLFRLSAAFGMLSFDSALLVLKPWSLVTYPLITSPNESPLGLLFGGYWMWVAGGSLERSWSTKRFTLFFFGMSAISALGMFVGNLLLGGSVGLTGLWLPLAGLTVAFAMMNPEQVILFFFVIPLKLKYLALIDVVLVFLSYARMNPLFGFFALTGCAFSYWYVVRGRNADYSSSRFDEKERVIRLYAKKSIGERANPLKWYSNYKERKRFDDFLNK